MKRIICLLSMLILLACKNTSETEIKTPPNQTNKSIQNEVDKDLNTTSSQSEVAFKDEGLSAVYDSYLKLKAALVNTNNAEAKAKAVILSQSLDTIATVKDDTRIAVKEIIGATDIKSQRVSFEKVSQRIEQLLADQILLGTIYKQYCPMAFNGKGAYWLSDSKEIRNPYFGDQMLTCGAVDKALE